MIQRAHYTCAFLRICLITFAQIHGHGFIKYLSSSGKSAFASVNVMKVLNELLWEFPFIKIIHVSPLDPVAFSIALFTLVEIFSRVIH